MKLSELIAPKGTNKRKKRRGRGARSGHGKTSCRGHKGANARSGPTTYLGFEGGQMSLIRRLPKRGFINANKEVFQVVNVEALNIFKNNDIVDVKSLYVNGLVREPNRPVKILGSGELTKPLTVRLSAFSESAKKKIEEAGGKIDNAASVR